MQGLKSKRREQKLTQIELAKILGCSSYAIYSYESGRRFPNKETLKKMAQFFDCTIDELM